MPFVVFGTKIWIPNASIHFKKRTAIRELLSETMSSQLLFQNDKGGASEGEPRVALMPKPFGTYEMVNKRSNVLIIGMTHGRLFTYGAQIEDI